MGVPAASSSCSLRQGNADIVVDSYRALDGFWVERKSNGTSFSDNWRPLTSGGAIVLSPRKMSSSQLASVHYYLCLQQHLPHSCSALQRRTLLAGILLLCRSLSCTNCSFRLTHFSLFALTLHQVAIILPKSNFSHTVHVIMQLETPCAYLAYQTSDHVDKRRDGVMWRQWASCGSTLFVFRVAFEFRQWSSRTQDVFFPCPPSLHSSANGLVFGSPDWSTET